VIAELVAAGLRPVMLTGDREPIARRMAEAVGLEDFRAGLSPEEMTESGIGPGTIRLSCGLEDVDDVLALADERGSDEVDALLNAAGRGVDVWAGAPLAIGAGKRLTD
jgi:magnesium-transporting ATPase (P-type)